MHRVPASAGEFVTRTERQHENLGRPLRGPSAGAVNRGSAAAAPRPPDEATRGVYDGRDLAPRRLPPVRPFAIRLASCVFVAAAPMACAMFAEPAAPPTTVTAAAPDRVRLVIYRPGATHLLGVVGERPITIAAQPACALGNNRFFVRDVAPGPIVITDGTARLELVAEPGRRYIVRVAFNPHRASLAGWILPLVGLDPDAGTTGAGPFVLEAIDPPQADAELVRLDPEPACA